MEKSTKKRRSLNTLDEKVLCKIRNYFSVSTTKTKELLDIAFYVNSLETATVHEQIYLS